MPQKYLVPCLAFEQCKCPAVIQMPSTSLSISLSLVREKYHSLHLNVFLVRYQSRCIKEIPFEWTYLDHFQVLRTHLHAQLLPENHPLIAWKALDFLPPLNSAP